MKTIGFSGLHLVLANVEPRGLSRGSGWIEFGCRVSQTEVFVYSGHSIHGVYSHWDLTAEALDPYIFFVVSQSRRCLGIWECTDEIQYMYFQIFSSLVFGEIEVFSCVD